MSKTVKIILIICGALAVIGIPILLILLTLAVPAMQKVTIKAHETSVIQSLRVLNSAEGEYNSTYPKYGFACSLTALGGTPASGAPTPEAAQIIGDDLTTGHKAGYTFVISGCTKKTVDNHDEFLTYKITAVPDRVGHTGNLGYCTDQDAQIKFDPTGGTNCTELLQ
jgi:type IV pilus assembly protein PilA